MLLSPEAVIQNLKDAGCGPQAIRRFENCASLQERLQFLARQRGRLLESLHTQQRRIDCLDYLVYQLEKNETRGETFLPLNGKEDRPHECDREQDL